MIIGPCGDANPNIPCMIDKKCSKNNPKAFNQETTIDGNNHPVFKRRDSAIAAVLENRSVVPYNAGLHLMFDAHINVEWSNITRAIKYLIKYICRGLDRATMVISHGQTKEIKSYLDCRCILECKDT
ncbi:UvrABC system protein C [Bienertia sinuspersici]